MTIAALERFSDPSRRCEPRCIGAAETQVVRWSLPNPIDTPLACVRRIPRALADWLTLPLPSPIAGGFFAVACIAVARDSAPCSERPSCSRRCGEVDAVAAFSAKDFGLATRLTEETGSQCREVLARGTQYFGEFAFELLAVVPYAYWLHT